MAGWIHLIIWCQSSFTSVPNVPAINTIKDKLTKDKLVQQWTSMAVHHIIILLEFCLKNTHFAYQSSYYEQLEGAAMGSPISPIVANWYMEEFEAKALSMSLHSISLGKRYVNDTSVVIKIVHKEEILNHINSIDEGIQFTSKDTTSDSFMPFLETPWSSHSPMTA